MAEQSLADIFCPSIMDFIKCETDSEEVDFDVGQLLRQLPDIDVQLDSDPVGPGLTSPSGHRP